MFQTIRRGVPISPIVSIVRHRLGSRLHAFKLSSGRVHPIRAVGLRDRPTSPRSLGRHSVSRSLNETLPARCFEVMAELCCVLAQGERTEPHPPINPFAAKDFCGKWSAPSRPVSWTAGHEIAFAPLLGPVNRHLNEEATFRARRCGWRAPG